ncbi:flagellar hook-length control protein FliK [Pseudoduganella buxea]|uniref:Flagellar hook-length control protein-like C-terminal domain-containing protein n=1 Tax=Pseudoduganella buxea TaxID=1949069 RepID=A0A6I3T2P7_9BURK|nr:flagellar hook-length control protein FliK [Pseudoduganella buxea]MTV55848.1 hypothetical protein [Pseudoduganella buxea]GGC23453.1 hypothetical protein GCM10011572_51210 [Pseudoduganella buxea]
MQTQSLQNTLLNTAMPSGQKSTANAGDTDFKHALARQVERQPAPPPAPVIKQAAPIKVNVPQTQSAPAPKTPQAPNSPPKAPAQAKAAQPANTANAANAANATAATNAAQGAEKTEQATTTAATSAAAGTAETAQAATDPAAEATSVTDAAMAAAAAAVDPMAAMLAMVAAYNQSGNAAAPAADAGGEDATGAATEGDPLAALQGEGEDGGKHGKGMGADPATLRAAADTAKGQLAGDGVPVNARAELTAGAVQTGIKAEAFAAKLAEASAEAPAVLPQATQALVATAQAADVAASNSLQARVGSNAWEQQLGQKVVWMVAGGDQTASLTLNPPDLGPMQVVLSVSNEQTSVSFMAAEPETRQALEDALPKLRETMSEAGIELGSATVSTGTQDQRQAFAEQAEARAAAAAGRGNHRASNGVDEPAPAEPVVRRTVLGAVDTFA